MKLAASQAAEANAEAASQAGDAPAAASSRAEIIPKPSMMSVAESHKEMPKEESDEENKDPIAKAKFSGVFGQTMSGVS